MSLTQVFQAAGNFTSAVQKWAMFSESTIAIKECFLPTSQKTWKIKQCHSETCVEWMKTMNVLGEQIKLVVRVVTGSESPESHRPNLHGTRQHFARRQTWNLQIWPNFYFPKRVCSTRQIISFGVWNNSLDWRSFIHTPCFVRVGTERSWANKDLRLKYPQCIAKTECETTSHNLIFRISKNTSRSKSTHTRGPLSNRSDCCVFLIHGQSQKEQHTFSQSCRSSNRHTFLLHCFVLERSPFWKHSGTERLLSSWSLNSTRKVFS